jgi:hypothetical protein
MIKAVAEMVALTADNIAQMRHIVHIRESRRDEHVPLPLNREDLLRLAHFSSYLLLFELCQGRCSRVHRILFIQFVVGCRAD